MSNNVFRRIPSITELIEQTPLRAMADKVSRNVVVNEARNFLDNMRQELVARADDYSIPSASELAQRIAQWIDQLEKPTLAPAINATGVLLHTGLGRAPLAESAITAVAAIGSQYATLEIDPDSGSRGQRSAAVERLLCELTSAQSALVCNNNAAATMLALSHLGAGREVLVSRGELVEIGGSYRLPDVMAASGALLREVGTTNKTRIGDYRDACNESTAALLRCHSSNFRIVGFTEKPTTTQLVELARAKELPFIDDVGSGALIDLSPYGIRDEPLVKESVEAGADVVLFSGDKLLGGPQCGIAVGKKKTIDAMARHPMMRAVRVGKMTLAALSATLELYRDVETAIANIPFLRCLTTSIENLSNRAERMAPQLAAAASVESAQVVDGESPLGGGTVPAQAIPTKCISLQPTDMSIDRFARALRMGEPPVFSRIQKDRLLIDLRTVLPSQDVALVDAIRAVPFSRTTSQEASP